MAQCLIVYHSRTGGSRQMAEAAAGTARDELETVLKAAAEAGPDDLLRGFPDLAAVAAECPRGCDHEAGALECELDAWVARGDAGPAGEARLDSFRRLLSARSASAVDHAP